MAENSPEPKDTSTEFTPLESTLREGSALSPPIKKKPRLSLRAILREVLDQPFGSTRKAKKAGRRIVEFIVSKILLNQKVENSQLVKLVFDHIDGTPTQTIIDLAGPDDIFDGMTTETILREVMGIDVVVEPGGKFIPRPKNNKRSAAKKKGAAKKPARKKRARRPAPREEEEGE